MLALLNDDTYPKIRKSLMICLVLVCVVAHYELGIKFPQVFFDLPDRVIEPRTTLLALWSLCIYLGLRYLSHYRAHRIRYQARLDYNAEFAAKANHYKGEIESLRDQTRGMLKSLEGHLQRYEHFEESSKGADVGYAAALEALERVAQSAKLDEVVAFSEDIKGGLGDLIKDARNQRQGFELQIGFLKTALREVKTGRPLLEELMAEPSIKHFDQQADAETVSGEILGRDQFLTSLAGVGLLLALATMTTLKFYFL